MKVYIHTDLEGVSGVVGRPAEGVGNAILNKEVANRLLTQEVNATADGLLEGGADEIVCWDGHGGSNSINIEELHPEVQLYQCGGEVWPLRLVDKSFAAVAQIGAHAMMGVSDGFLNHTYNSHAVVNMWLNDRLIGEIGMTAALAGAARVPTILVSGDRAACREAAEFIEGVETVETKAAVSRYSVINRHPKKVRADLKAAAARALGRLTDFVPRVDPPPYRIKVQFMCPNMADRTEKAGAQRLDHVTVMYESDDLLDAWAQRCFWARGAHQARFPDAHGS